MLSLKMRVSQPRATKAAVARRWLLVILLGSTTLASCTDEVPDLTQPERAVIGIPSDLRLQDAQVQGLFSGERAFLEIASREPAFAGTFLEGNVLVVNVSNPASRGVVAAEVRETLLPEIQRRGRALGGVEIRDVQYSFLELANWRNLAWRHVMSLDDVTSLDLDERENLVRIGLETGSGRARVASVLDSLDIPTGATAIEVVGPAVPSVLVKERNPAPKTFVTTLKNRERPIPGGVRFEVYNPSFNSYCTIGFNARRYPNGNHYLITASHCSYEVYGLDAGTTYAYQASSSDTIGSESVDPDPWSCTWPWEPDDCRYSDAAAYAYRTSVVDSMDFGTIARPVGPPGTGSNAGSIYIDSSNPRFYINGSVNWAQAGDSVHKVGAYGGWTKGEVYATCTGINIAENSPHPRYRVTCGYRADYRGDEGDSGGPVFFRTGDTTVLLAGVNFGANASPYGNGIFSSFGAIFHTSYDNFFSQVQVWDAPLTGSIAGPLEAPPEESCTWSATNVSGGVWPYSYQWSGALSGTNINVTGTIQAPGEWLYLTITDAASNHLYDQIYIPVDEGSEGCDY